MSRLVSTLIRMDTPEALARQVALEVEAARKAAGISQRALSETTGIPLVTLNRRLTGQGKPFTFAEVAAVAAALGTTLTDISLRAERNVGRTAA